jgi:hypothetical protein
VKYGRDWTREGPDAEYTRHHMLSNPNTGLIGLEDKAQPPDLVLISETTRADSVGRFIAAWREHSIRGQLLSSMTIPEF